MEFYETDLRNDLADNVPTQPGIDEAEHQHLVNFTIAFGINGKLDPITDDPLALGFSWPEPVSGESTTVDDMWHAAYNSRGKYLNAKNPVEFERALNAALSSIAERTATAAAVSINSAKLTTQSVVYLAQFNTNRWQGNLFAFKIVDLDTGALALTPEWTAADELNSRNIVTNPRTILTHDGADGAAFQWDDLSTAQQADLKTSPTGVTEADAIGKARLRYLRGDQADEGTRNFFRERLSLLADLVNSGPVFVGAPNLRWPDTAPFPTAIGARYSDYKNGTAATRDGMVYVGSNGGMMHGFAETDGEERIAYIANNLFSTGSGEGLHYLTEQDYMHKYYNDLTPTVSDIYANLGTGVRWHTVLVSGQRGGGRGIFALDVTKPTGFTESNASDIVLWEFTNSDDPDLGFTYSRPQIGMTNAGTWVAIFGNGYNDTGDGKAKLFIVDIAKGADGVWSTGDYIEINTNSGSTTDRNGLGTPALADLDGDGTIDRVYAGDLKGQMWAFDLSDTSSAAWGIPGTAPLFTTNGNQPITSKPTLTKHPTVLDDGSNDPNVMVFFGSGQYLVDTDKTSTDVNYFYGVWDKGDDGLDSSDLVEQFYDSAFSERVLTRNSVGYLSGDYGWFFELPDSGERSVTNPVVRGSLVFFNSFVPVTDPCSVGGYGYRFAVNVIDGGSPDKVAVDTNDDGIIDDSDRASDGSGGTDTIAAIRQEGFLPEPVFIEDIAYTAETPSKVKSLPSPPTGRFGWQELLQ
jgi:type IV pilus assembly protein PilY1